MGYAFRSSLYGCVANGRVVMLDLAADRYFALPGPTDAAVQEAFAGKLPNIAAMAGLVERGLIVETEVKNQLYPTVHTPARDTKSSAINYAPRLIPPVVPVLAQLQTKRDLKARSLHDVIERLRSNKGRHTNRIHPVDPGRAERAVARYNSSRRFISAQDECLRWSIAMVRYLSRHRYYPDLILGVRMMPFAAHAWVQDGDTVLNDTVEYVSAYTPILVV